MRDDSPLAPVITVDGPGGAGKGTISQQLAEWLGWNFLDSGALYRILALAALREGVPLTDGSRLADLAGRIEIGFGAGDHPGQSRAFLNREDVSGEIRGEDCGAAASKLAVLPAVRSALLDVQRRMRRAPGLVADGRDMGTVVFPDAQVKIFLTATPEERARRRYNQLKQKGMDVSLAKISREVLERDRRDAERKVSPLRPAEDARILDSTELSIPEVLERARQLVQQYLATR